MMKDKKPQNNKESFDPNANKDVKELTHKALVSFLKDQLKDKASNKTDLDVLSVQISEFLNSFILIGYTLQGEPVSIISAHNQQEADSLGTLLNKFMFNSNNKDFPGE